jgi:hypothetical protein
MDYHTKLVLIISLLMCVPLSFYTAVAHMVLYINSLKIDVS